jgi:hypothetical protein
MEIQLADDVRAELMRLLHEERDKDRALLERLVAHLTVPPRSTWRVVELAGDGTPHDVPLEFPAQVVYIDNGSTKSVQVRAPGDIAQSPPIAASGQGRWLIPGATQVTVTGSGTGQVRLRFLNDAAARLLADNPPGGSTTSPVYASLTGKLPQSYNTNAYQPQILGTVTQADWTGDVLGVAVIRTSDGMSLTVQPGSLITASLGVLYNGSTLDRQRGIPGSDGVPATAASGMQSLAITTATTTAVKASAGVIGTLSNASGAATSTITVYDSTTGSGKTLWSGTLSAGQVLPLGIPCATGITVVTAAADAIAVTYA